MYYLKKTAPSVLLIILLIGFPQISETIYTPALPDITHSLMTSSKLVQWTLSVYFIGFAFGVFYWGSLSDGIGRRPTMLLGILIYSLSTLSCLLSPSITWLLFSRIIQAFGASVGSVIVLTIIREAFADRERLKVFSLVSISLSLTPALGPFIGGYVSQWLGWRANFTVLLMVGLALILYSFIALPETKSTQVQQKKIVKTNKLAIQFIKDPKVLGCIWIVGAINGLLFSYYSEAPFIFIKIIGLTPGQYGWLGILIAVASMLGATISYRLSSYFSSQQIICGGILIMLISASFFSFFTLMGWINSAYVIRSVLLIMLPMAIIIGCFGVVTPAILSNALDNYKSVLGTAGALFGLSYYFLTAGFTWLMGSLHNGSINPMPLYFLALTSSILLVYLFMQYKRHTG